MAYENAPGTGALFPNDRKTSDNQPDRTGHIVAHRDIKAGEKLRLAAWIKEGRKGKFLSLRMSDAPRHDGIKDKLRDVQRLGQEIEEEPPF